MNVDKLARNLRFLWRAESVIADIHLRHLGRSSAFAAAAVLLIALAVCMLSLAAFLALEPLWGAAWAAAGIGGAHVYLAAMAALFAHRAKPARELQLANEVRQAALNALQDDAQAIQAEMAAFAHAIRHPFDAALPGMIVPLAGIVLKALKKQGSSAGT